MHLSKKATVSIPEAMKELKFAKYFWNSILFLYGLTGLSASLVSFSYETSFITQLFGNFWLALLMTGSFESCKILTILVYGVLNYHFMFEKVTSFQRILVLVTKIGLISLSVYASLAFISSQLDRPHLEAVRKHHIEEARGVFSGRKASINESYFERKKLLESEHEAAVQDLMQEDVAFYKKRIDDLDNELIKESQRVVNGVVQGVRYHALEDQKNDVHRRLKNLNKRYYLDRKRLKDDFLRDVNALDTWRRNALESARNEMKAAIEKIRNSPYKNNEAVFNAMFYSTLKVLNDSLFQHFNMKVPMLMAVLFVALHIALLLECVIIISLRALVTTFVPKFKMADMYMCETEKASQRLMERIKKKNSTVSKMEHLASKQLDDLEEWKEQL